MSRYYKFTANNPGDDSFGYINKYSASASRALATRVHWKVELALRLRTCLADLFDPIRNQLTGINRTGAVARATAGSPTAAVNKHGRWEVRTSSTFVHRVL